MMILTFLLVFCAVNADGDKEGDYCTKKGVPGVCTNIRDCAAAQEDIKNRKLPQHCGLGGTDFIVCCVSTNTTVLEGNPESSNSSANDFSDDDEEEDRCEPLPPSLTSKPTGQKAWDKCLEYQRKLVFPCAFHYNYHALPPGSGWNGFSRSNRCHHTADELVSEGGPAARGEFPHMALLGYGDDPSKLRWQCGGSLISDKFVLTSANCATPRIIPPVSYVQLRIHRRSSMPLRNRYAVKNITVHPEFMSRQWYHDIALLELDRQVPLDEFTVPACIHTGAPVDDSRASVPGWGRLEPVGNLQDILQEKTMIKFKEVACGIIFQNKHILLKTGFDHITQICYGPKEATRDVCVGDTGGPLQIKHKQISCMYTVIGVSSGGTQCFTGLPSIFTRVEHYLDWIETIVWPSN